MLPLAGVLGVHALERLYGVNLSSRLFLRDASSLEETGKRNGENSVTVKNINDGKLQDKDNEEDSDASALDNVVLALQHRAVLFGGLGFGLLSVVSDAPQHTRKMMICMTLLSDFSFLTLALPRWKALTREMKKVVYADILSIFCLFRAAA